MRERPGDSASVVLSRGQKVVFIALLVLVAVGLVLRPLDTVVAFNIFAIIVYTAVIVYRFRLVTYSLGHELQLPVGRAEIEALDERTLPVYTILVPLYREPELVGRPDRWPLEARLPEDEARHQAPARGRRRGDAGGGAGAQPPAPLPDRDRPGLACRRRSRRPATTACCRRAATSSSSTTPRTSPNPTSSRRRSSPSAKRRPTSSACSASSTTSTSTSPCSPAGSRASTRCGST